MNDKNIKAISAFEQASAFLGIYAAFLNSYHKDLCKAGFNRNEALALAKDLQRSMFKDALKNLGPDIEDE
jgi:hypothetical protein